MTAGWIRGILTGYSEFVLVYFFALNASYIALCTLSFFLIRNHMRCSDPNGSGFLFRSGLAPAVSIICPAYNEEASITASVRSLLSLEYPDLEVVVVNDGSRDRTLELLKQEFRLAVTPRSPSGNLPAAAVLGIYRSASNPRLVVVDKENGGSKSDALNAGINYTRNPLVCCIDADSLLESGSLLKMVRPFVERPETVAAGGVVRIVNGSRVGPGGVLEPRIPGNALARFQVIEYLRGFLFGRMGWAAVNALPIVSGAFGIFSRRSVLEVGGYRHDTIGEDMELILRLHRHHRSRKIPYRIDFVPEPICWTEAPESLRVLARQRNRWQRGLIDSVWLNRTMLLNRAYGPVGLLSLPFYFLFEMAGPVIEAAGYASVIAAFAMGVLSWQFAWAFLCVSMLLGMVLSLGALLLEGLTYRRYSDPRAVGILILFGVLENLGFRQLHTFWRLQGTWDRLRGRTEWGRMSRRGFAGTSAAAPTEPAEAA